MNTIFISKPVNKNPKFLNFLSNTNNAIINNDNIKIFEYIYHNIKTFVIHESNIDNIVLNFLQEYVGKVNILLYLEDNSEIFIDNPNIIHLSRTRETNDNTINISKYTVKELFNQNNTDHSQSNIACFIDHMSELGTQMTQAIESINKNENYKIRLFNNSQIHHAHNIGILKEKDKSYVLKTHKYFLDNGSEYLNEAILSNCEVLNLESVLSTSDDNIFLSSRRASMVVRTHEDISTFNEKFCI
jgi:hypothetical protein